jgi:8-oxo-dGTP diphosphatase
LPVAVALLPVDTDGGRRGLVVVRRDIEPARGQLSLPGGFIEVGESWQEAAVRELIEETGIPADPGAVKLFDVHSAPIGTVLIFGLLPPRKAPDLPPVAPTEEASEWLVATSALPLAFSTHTRAMQDYFRRQRALRSGDRSGRQDEDRGPDWSEGGQAAGI